MPEDCEDICRKAESCLTERKLLRSCDDVCGGARDAIEEYACMALETGKPDGWSCDALAACVKDTRAPRPRRRKGDEGKMGKPR